jgi:hypothetical protein
MGSDPPGAIGSNGSTPEKDDSIDAEQEAGGDDMAEKDDDKEEEVSDKAKISPGSADKVEAPVVKATKTQASPSPVEAPFPSLGSATPVNAAAMVGSKMETSKSHIETVTVGTAEPATVGATDPQSPAQAQSQSVSIALTKHAPIPVSQAVATSTKERPVLKSPPPTTTPTPAVQQSVLQPGTAATSTPLHLPVTVPVQPTQTHQPPTIQIPAMPADASTASTPTTPMAGNNKNVNNNLVPHLVPDSTVVAQVVQDMVALLQTCKFQEQGGVQVYLWDCLSFICYTYC